MQLEDFDDGPHATVIISANLNNTDTGFYSRPRFHYGVEQWGIYRQVSAPCTVDKPFQYNRAFNCDDNYGRFRDGSFFKLPPPDNIYTHGSRAVPVRDGVYRTVFGPSVAHDGVIYCKCFPCLALASRRLTELRTGTLAGDALLTAVQSRFVRLFVQPFILEFVSSIPQYKPPVGLIEDARWYHALPHAKLVLRKQSWGWLSNSKGFHPTTWRKVADALFKSDEYARPEKYPRQVVNCTTENALQGGYFAEFVKKLLSAPMVGTNITTQFIPSPKPEDIDAVFDKLINTDNCYFPYFSDDSCLSIYRNGRRRMFNVDISGCDRSHGPELFNTLLVVFRSYPEHARALIRHCKLPLRYRDKTRTWSVLLRPKTPKLYSGSIATTILANFASTAIGLALERELTADIDATVPELVTRVEKACGYTITLDECFKAQDLQFLKHSPTRDTQGVFRAVQNIGVVLRLIGTCRGDLPGSGDLAVRAINFQDNLLRGLHVRTSFPWIDAFKTIVQAQNKRYVKLACDCALHENFGSYLQCKIHGSTLGTQSRVLERHIFDDNEVFARYNFTSNDLDEIYALTKGRIGESFSGVAFDKVLHKDYNLATRCTRYRQLH